MRPENVRARLGNVRLKSVRARLRNVGLESARARLGNVKARLGAVRLENMRLENMRLKNVRPQRSFSETDKARHLQLHLPGLDGNTAEHQQLRRLWLEDNRFGKCTERKWISY